MGRLFFVERRKNKEFKNFMEKELVCKQCGFIGNYRQFWKHHSGCCYFHLEVEYPKNNNLVNLLIIVPRVKGRNEGQGKKTNTYNVFMNLNVFICRLN